MIKSIRKLLAGLTAGVVLLSASGLSMADGEFEDAATCVSHISVGWNLGNTLDSNGAWINGSDPSSYETAWGNVSTTQAMIDSVRDQGFNAIRIPVTWAQHIDANGNVDSAWMARVKEVVDYAYNDGLYVILNVHHDTGTNQDTDDVSWVFAENSCYSSVQNKYAGLWTSIANEFSDYDQRLLFEGYNEIIDNSNTWNAPSNSSSYQAVNDFAQLFVDTVRATGGNNASRNLIINTYVSSVDQAVLDNLVIPTDSASNHLICEVHVYAPWGFTGLASEVNWTPVHSDFGSSDQSEIDDIMNRLSSFSSSHNNIPVIIGECGAQYKNNDAAIADYAGYLVGAAASRGIKCFWWDNGIYGSGSSEGGYAIFNRSTLEWKIGIVSAMMDAAVFTPADVPAVEPEVQPSESVAETEETTAMTEASVTESSETANSETEIAETTAVETTVLENADVTSKDSNVKRVLFIAGGVVLVVGAYVGLFMLGRTKRR